MSELPPDNENWNEDVVRSAEDNHIWLNAFLCVSPSDEFLLDVGRMVVNMLKDRHNLIVPRVRLIESSRELVVRINQS